MKIGTWNVNGIRAAVRKGLIEGVAALELDVLLLQEVRCDEATALALLEPMGGFWAWNAAVKPGYAGTAVWTRRPHDSVMCGLGGRDVDAEGRVLTVHFEGAEVTSVYLPSGSSGAHRQVAKEAWMRRFRPWATRRLEAALTVGRLAVLGGDFNNALTERDLYYAKGNAKNSGFMPHERKWQARLIASGWRDVVRETYGDVDGPYTWWSNRGQARALDRGWRIDYLLANKAAADQARRVEVHREASLGVSDHALLTMEWV